MAGRNLAARKKVMTVASRIDSESQRAGPAAPAARPAPSRAVDLVALGAQQRRHAAGPDQVADADHHHDLARLPQPRGQHAGPAAVARRRSGGRTARARSGAAGRARRAASPARSPAIHSSTTRRYEVGSCWISETVQFSEAIWSLTGAPARKPICWLAVSNARRLAVGGRRRLDLALDAVGGARRRPARPRRSTA